jgi:hypothetical protein
MLAKVIKTPRGYVQSLTAQTLFTRKRSSDFQLRYQSSASLIYVSTGQSCLYCTPSRTDIEFGLYVLSVRIAQQREKLLRPDRL